ncbi:MAG: SDR family oxidoreductase [Desulfobacterales bacterium]|jgi:NAD(P)-dependent dehydrogenase (short-subunit alcohol dehydrogenase family)
MDLQLEGKQAIVTGSTQGIGFAIAAALAGEGASVVVNGRTQDKVEKALDRLDEQAGGTIKARGVAADLGTAEGAAKMISEVPEADILVNNAGIFDPTPFENIEDADWERFWQVNVMSGVRLSRHYLPIMKQKNWGRIVFISSESGLHIPAEMIHYGVTKSAQISLARGMAETTRATGVTVNSVLPGPTASEGVMTFVERMAEENGITNEQMEEEFFKTARPSSLLQRFTEPEEIARMVAFLCSPLSSATNGAPIRVDGGVVRSMA